MLLWTLRGVDLLELCFLHTHGGPSNIVPFVSCAESYAFRIPLLCSFLVAIPPSWAEASPAPSSVHDAHLAPSPLEYGLLPKWGPLLVSHCILTVHPFH